MMSSRYLYNIKGCIEKYQDFETSRVWLAKGQSELDITSFSVLLNELLLWFVDTKSQHAHVESMSALLEEFSIDLRAKLSEELNKRQQAEAAEQEEIERQEQCAAQLRAQRKREAERRAAFEEATYRRQQEERKEKERQQYLQHEARQKELERQKQAANEFAKKKQLLLDELHANFESNFLLCENFFRTSCESHITFTDFTAERRSFVRQWFARNMPAAAGKEQHLPDDEQIEAISALDKQIQVIARAGSGKTATLVNRALFLIKHCRVAPSEILVLAFNRKAALEIRRRLLNYLKDGAELAVKSEIDRRLREIRARKSDVFEVEETAVNAISSQLRVTLPHVMTFHALAHAIVKPEEQLLYNSSDGESQGLNRVYQQVIDDHFQIPAFKKKIKELMLAHFREDWDKIIKGGYDKSKDELLEYRRSLPRVSLNGDYVKSFGEKIIANFLFEHDIPYKYERNHWWSGINYHPDFTIFKNNKSGVIIEYFGLQGDADYDEMSEQKRNYWRAKTDWNLIEFGPMDIASNGAEGFAALLKQSLESHGIECNRLSEDDIWHRIRERAIDSFTKAMGSFISRCRKVSLTPGSLKTLVERYSPLSEVEKIFLRLSIYIYNAYLERLVATGEDDFDGLMQKAAIKISSGDSFFKSNKFGHGDLKTIRYACIDEFQDFSDLFYRLLSAIRAQNPRVRLFCVGDDWQAINGFAGSDLRFYKKFHEYVGESTKIYISTNYRSPKQIVDTGNALMAGLGRPARAHKETYGEVLLSDLNEFKPTLIERQRNPGDAITPAVLRLIWKSIQEDLNTVMLCRRNAIPWFVNYQGRKGAESRGLISYLDIIQSCFPKYLREKISISTAHKYKGLEQKVVIVLDVIMRSYPLIHPDWVFSRILGDSLEKIAEEERRLLYVALTRATERLVIITDGRNKSPFLVELGQRQPLMKIDWTEFPPVRGATAYLVVKVGNQDRKGVTPTVEIKDLLKATGYQWQSVGWPCWEKSFQVTEFTIDAIQSELWAEPADGIEVRVLNDTEVLVAHYLVNVGKWHCIMDRVASLCAQESESD